MQLPVVWEKLDICWREPAMKVSAWRYVGEKQLDVRAWGVGWE